MPSPISKHTKTRIDLFVKGEAGYINNVLVDYSQNQHNLKDWIAYCSSSKTSITDINNNTVQVDTYVFVETFVKYSFTGDTISVGEGEGVETITGSKQTEDKIDIIYTITKNPEIPEIP